MGKLTVDTLKAGSVEYGKDASIENEIEAIFTYTASGRAVLHFKDNDLGYSKKVRLTVKKPDETQGFRANGDDTSIDNVPKGMKAYITFIED